MEYKTYQQLTEINYTAVSDHFQKFLPSSNKMSKILYKILQDK